MTNSFKKWCRDLPKGLLIAYIGSLRTTLSLSLFGSTAFSWTALGRMTFFWTTLGKMTRVQMTITWKKQNDGIKMTISRATIIAMTDVNKLNGTQQNDICKNDVELSNNHQNHVYTKNNLQNDVHTNDNRPNNTAILLSVILLCLSLCWVSFWWVLYN